MKSIKLGTIVKDKVTDFQGMAISRCVYLNGCVKYGVQPRELKDGKTIDQEWIDEGQLEVVEENAFDTTPKDTGGPGDMPKADRTPPKF